MHRIDTSTVLKDKFGAGKNGFTDGDPATGREATDLDADMWDEVQEEIIAPIEAAGIPLRKGVRNQLLTALKKLFVSSNDSRLSGILLKNNNLSDVADKAAARKNLELKEAATHGVQTSPTDVTPETLLKVGGFGIGTPITVTGVSDFHTWARTASTGIYYFPNKVTNLRSHMVVFFRDASQQDAWFSFGLTENLAQNASGLSVQANFQNHSWDIGLGGG